jgi:NAD(P)-dependent dehydrogenase (short-subunit alcohol dehydrogenase family)
LSEFAGRVAIVTGASGNLGSAAAKMLYMLGAKLVLVDRHLEALHNIYDDFVDPNNVFFSAPTNVLDENSVDDMINEALNRFERIDILLNIVGGYYAGTPVHETSLDTWDFMLNLNARSVVIASSAVIPTMLEQKSGKIINIASRAAIRGTANAAAYSASKSAVLRITESMSAELKVSGVNVNCVIPGTIDTRDNRLAMPEADYNHWVSPDSIAEVILFLASETARDVHGAAIPIYGLS